MSNDMIRVTDGTNQLVTVKAMQYGIKRTYVGSQEDAVKRLQDDLYAYGYPRWSEVVVHRVQ